jgi:NAD(P) transhydrogenase
MYGVGYRVKHGFTIEDLIYRAHHVMKREINVIESQMARNHIDLLRGTAKFVDARRLRVDSATKSVEHTAEYIVIAVGSIPARPLYIPFDDERVIDSDGMLSLPKLPSSLTIIGGGVIGTEYATIFAAAGLPVVLIEATAKAVGTRRLRDDRSVAVSHEEFGNHTAIE